MSISAIAAIIAATYGALLLLWLLTLPFSRRAFSRQAVLLDPKPDTFPASRRPSGRIAAAALAVFMANIATMGWILASAVWPNLGGLLERVDIPLSIEIHLIGAVLFILNGLWGLLVLIFNPSYSPFFLKRKGQIPLATQGPYAIIRHPRYASEAALNVILFLFTGVWIPLLGTLGWAALRRQAISEEEFLLGSSPTEYGRYMGVTGRFLPRWKFRKED